MSNYVNVYTILFEWYSRFFGDVGFVVVYYKSHTTSSISNNSTDNSTMSDNSSTPSIPVIREKISDADFELLVYWIKRQAKLEIQ